LFGSEGVDLLITAGTEGVSIRGEGVFVTETGVTTAVAEGVISPLLPLLHPVNIQLMIKIIQINFIFIFFLLSFFFQ
jgi:hypothetical protein